MKQEETIIFMGCGWRFPFCFGVAKYYQDLKQTQGTTYSYGGVLSEVSEKSC